MGLWPFPCFPVLDFRPADWSRASYPAEDLDETSSQAYYPAEDRVPTLYPVYSILCSSYSWYSLCIHLLGATVLVCCSISYIFSEFFFSVKAIQYRSSVTNIWAWKEYSDSRLAGNWEGEIASLSHWRTGVWQKASCVMVFVPLFRCRSFVHSFTVWCGLLFVWNSRFLLISGV